MAVGVLQRKWLDKRLKTFCHIILGSIAHYHAIKKIKAVEAFIFDLSNKAFRGTGES